MALTRTSTFASRPWTTHALPLRQGDHGVNTDPHTSTVRVTVYEFSMGDVEDPELYASQAIYRWQHTEEGKWLGEHSSELTWHVTPDVEYYGYRCVIRATLSEQDHIVWALRWRTK